MLQLLSDNPDNKTILRISYSIPVESTRQPYKYWEANVDFLKLFVLIPWSSFVMYGNMSTGAREQIIPR